MTAKSFGYGSVSKLATIAAGRPADECRFVGSGIALEFAARNREHFSSVDACDIEEGSPLEPWLADVDALVSVRNAEAVFWARRLGVRAVFVDSLLWFWRPVQAIEDLVQLARVLDELPTAAAWSRFQSLPVHDRAVMGHVLADVSLAQRFAGVDERVERLRAAGCVGVDVCGPIVDADPSGPDGRAGTPSVSSPGHGAEWDVVINVCGFDNFVLDSKANAPYLRLMERWAFDYVRARPQCRRALICGGPYRDGGVVEVGNAVIQFGALARDELLRVAGTAPRVLCSPGLTSCLEMVALGRVPRMGPPQHAGHLAAIRALQEQGFNRLGLDFCAVLGGDVPADDHAGTMAIVEQAQRVLDDPRAYRAVADELDALLDLSAAGADAGDQFELHRLRQLVAGPDARELISTALAGAVIGTERNGSDHAHR